MQKYLFILFPVFVLIAFFLTRLISADADSRTSVGQFEPLSAESLTSLVQAHWAGKEVAPDHNAGLDSQDADVYVVARSRGRRIARAWATEGTAWQALQHGVDTVKLAVMDANKLARIDRLEIVFAHQYRKVSIHKRGWQGNIHRGVRGLQVSHGDKLERYAPTYMLETNRGPKRLLELFASRHGIQRKKLNELDIQIFSADSWLIPLQAGQGVRMMRGNVQVPLNEVSRESTLELGMQATGWLRNNLRADGQMTYKYWPSIRQASKGNNMIRQWMATVALIRAAKYWQDDALMNAATQNIDYNLSQFYEQENDLGLIAFQGKVKLGAVALAALALAEHPLRERWQVQEQALLKTINFLWQEDGSFRTFYRPEGRNDVQNFYPGEALLYLATLYEMSRDDGLLNKIMQSFRYYRDWHLRPENRNPAFIPWHTQAYYKIWRLTRNEQLQQFVFEMNDWLVAEMQLPDSEHLYPDTHGRFYNPDRPYGPPHVSSTGVYMEGLIDAFEMSRALGDERRAEVYRWSIVRGLRSAMQLQFVDEVDMFYVPRSQRRYVRGGMRTTVYNNEIRCDNVQHNLMAVLKILSGFETPDYH